MFNKKEYMKNYRETHKQRTGEYNKQYRQNHLEYFRAYNKQRYFRLKHLVLTLYSTGIDDPIAHPKCNRCGQEDINKLELDHVFGGGTKDRKQITNGWGGDPYYRYLIDNHFPRGFQTLCKKCNIRKSFAERKKACMTN